MAYETFDTISWSDGTPLTSDRLQQMSTNIDLVKEVTDGYSRGVLSFKQDTTTHTAITDSTYTSIIALVNEGGGLDYRVTAAANRRIKITFTTPGIQIANGDENNVYSYRLYNGTATSDTLTQEWFFGLPSQDVIAPATATVEDTGTTNRTVLLSSSITAMTGTKKLGGGTFSVMVDSGATGLTTQNYTVFVGRSGGTASYNTLGTQPTQLYAEDCGSSV